MSTPASVKAAIAACIAAANNTTGKSATDVTEAVNDLISEFGNGDSGGAIKIGTVILDQAFSSPYTIPLDGKTDFFALLRTEQVTSSYIEETSAIIYTGELASYDIEVFKSYGPGTMMEMNKNTVAVVSNNAIALYPYCDLVPNVEYKYIAVYLNVAAPELPTLTNPATAVNIDSGKEAIVISDGEPVVITGTSTARSENDTAIETVQTALGGTYANIGAAVAAALAAGGSAVEQTSGTYVLDADSYSGFSIAHGLSGVPDLVLMLHDDVADGLGAFYHVGLFYIRNPIDGTMLISSSLQCDSTLKYTTAGTGCIGTAYGWTSEFSRVSADAQRFIINLCRYNFKAGTYTWYAFKFLT